VVSQTLPAQRELFDVVVFDEASQVTPADAIPAILRGRQLVIAGDSRQLPPTAFFAQATDEEDEDDVPVDAGTVGYESILDALGGLVPERMLTWHYRSEDERLIAFSNAHIYQRSLTTFPGVHTDDVIRHELVQWQPSEDGSEDTSSSEVDRVVDLIIDHAFNRPRESLGVIAMGLKHAERIAEELRHRRDELRVAPTDPDGYVADDDPEDDDATVGPIELTALLDEFFDERRDEPFFIKNLERVQGDERDAIILTVGYGKSRRPAACSTASAHCSTKAASDASTSRSRARNAAWWWCPHSQQTTSSPPSSTRTAPSSCAPTSPTPPAKAATWATRLTSRPNSTHSRSRSATPWPSTRSG